MYRIVSRSGLPQADTAEVGGWRVAIYAIQADV